jgi:hypothetical protein
MSYTTPDFADSVIGRLTLLGYTVHAGNDDGEPCDLTDGSGFWWTLSTDNSGAAGTVQDFELTAWDDALAHFIEAANRL